MCRKVDAVNVVLGFRLSLIIRTVSVEVGKARLIIRTASVEVSKARLIVRTASVEASKAALNSNMQSFRTRASNKEEYHAVTQATSFG